MFILFLIHSPVFLIVSLSAPSDKSLQLIDLFNAALKSSTSLSSLHPPSVIYVCRMRLVLFPVPLRINLLQRFPFLHVLFLTKCVVHPLSRHAFRFFHLFEEIILTSRTGESCFNVSWVSPSFSRRHRSLNVK
mgnify:CR=1 FL=1